MINRFFLAVVLLPKALYANLGVNNVHLKAILATKLLMDDRRPGTIQQTRKKEQAKPVKLATLGTMLLSAILGLFFVISFYVSKDTVTQFTIFFAFFIFLLASTLITDFTTVLIDVRDNAIILPKPVNDRTFLLARLLHIVIHVSKMMVPMSVPGLITVGIEKGMTGVFALMALIPFATLLTIFFINALYVFILKVTTPEKFKSIISYFQIGFTIFIYGAYQLVPRLINKSILENYSIPQDGWSLLIPPFWFAGGWQLLTHPQGSLILIIALLLSIAMPLISIWIVVKYFAPSFMQKLSMISGSELAENKQLVFTGNSTKPVASFAEKIALLVTKSGAERMGFMLAWHITSRSRDFKMRIYPSMGYLIVYLLIMANNNRNTGMNDIITQTKSGKMVFITAMYFIGFVIMQALLQIKFSDKSKAAWIYYTTPVAQPGNIISGAAKATILKFYLPLALVISALGTGFIGLKIVPNLLLGMSNQLLICFIIAYISATDLPFSKTETTTHKGGSFIRGMFSMLLPFGVATLHFFIYSYLPVVLLLLALSIIAIWLVAGSLYNRGWNKITGSYSD
jgi:ABC-2 type transport system permease protein